MMVDGTGRSDLSEEENKDLWNHFTSYWGEWYYDDVMQFQTNIQYHWLFFSNQVPFQFDYPADGDPVNWASVNPNWLRNASIPSDLDGLYNNVDTCEALSAAVNELNAMPHTKKMIIYLAFNTPEYPNSVTDCATRLGFSVDLSNVAIYGIRWDTDVDLDYVESEFGDFEQCTHVLDGDNWAPTSETTARSVLRYIQGTASDFVCWESGGLTDAPTRGM